MNEENPTTELESKLTAANARIAELEKANHEVSEQRDGLEKACREMQESWSQLERKYLGQLSESQAQLASIAAILPDSEDLELPELAKVVMQNLSDESERANKSEAQLASAREDGARIEWIGREVAYFELCGTEFKDGRLISIGLDARIDIDSARGVTSPPAVEETGGELGD